MFLVHHSVCIDKSQRAAAQARSACVRELLVGNGPGCRGLSRTATFARWAFLAWDHGGGMLRRAKCCSAQQREREREGGRERERGRE
eukprot:4840322-Alexandrium_andersonii.AAC.1